MRRFYRGLLRLLPASFHAEYQAEMLAIFERRLRAANGMPERARLAAGAAMDVAACAVRVHLDILQQDLRYFGRCLRRSPGFSSTVVVVAALGVGATTTAFSITDHVLLRPLPFPDADRLVQLWQDHSASPGSRIELSPANYRDFQRLSTSFEGIGAFNPTSVNLVGDGEPERVEAAAVSSEVFPVLGRRPLLGRSFGPEEDREGAPGTLVVSYGMWQERFGGDPGILGRSLQLDGEPYRVIGVMPREFRFPRRETRLWLPLRLARDAFEARDDLWLKSVARLRPGVSYQSARSEMDLVAAQLARQFPRENAGLQASLIRLRDQVGQQSRLLLLAVFGAAFAVLLIACTNLASLLLARALERRREIAVRAALGAGRERLARQLLTESLLLATLGGFLGVLLAVSAMPLLARLVPNALPIAEAPTLDWRILAFAALMTLVTAVGFGLAPAWRSLGDADAVGLRAGARAGARDGERLRSLLVVAEVAVAVVLLISSGLLIRALLRVQAIDPGFEPKGVVTLRTTLPMPKYQPIAARTAFHASVLAEVRALPGVTSAAYTSYLPIVMGGGIWTIEAEGQPLQPSAQRTASVRYVTPGYFETLGIAIRRGRDASESDTAATLQVAVVSESFARRYWPGQDPIGRRFRFGLLGSTSIARIGAFQDRTVVGVVGDVKVRGLERRNEPQVYLPYRQQPEGAMGFYTPQDLAVRHTGDPAALVAALRRVVARADPQQPVADVQTLAAIVQTQTAPRETQVVVLSAFAAVAVLLAGIGLHGLLACLVAGRSREIGVRRALGAHAGDIVRLVLRRGLGLAGVGVALGLLLAYSAGRTLEALLAGVSPRDGVTFAAAAGVALLAALAGSLLPAWRAVRVDPLSAIRVE